MCWQALAFSIMLTRASSYLTNIKRLINRMSPLLQPESHHNVLSCNCQKFNLIKSCEPYSYQLQLFVPALRIPEETIQAQTFVFALES